MGSGDMDGVQIVQVDCEGENHSLGVSTNLIMKVKECMLHFLTFNMDVFAWKLGDMPSIDPMIIAHKSNVDPKARPIQQKENKIHKREE